jgi:hypothetical protein
MPWESISVTLYTRSNSPGYLSPSSDWLGAGLLGFESRQGQHISLRNIQTGSEVHTDSYPIGTEGSCPEIKRPEREADDPQSIDEFKNDEATPSLPHLHCIVLN